MRCVIITGSNENRRSIMDELWRVYYFERKNGVAS